MRCPTVGRSKVWRSRALSQHLWGEWGSERFCVGSREREQAEMAALLGVLGCSSLGFRSSCTKLGFGFAFVFLNLLKGLYYSVALKKCLLPKKVS